ncbi:hypothetical protein CP8484711_1742, partial [Chlamydia psittaci 84-8471/1]
FLIRRTTAF